VISAAFFEQTSDQDCVEVDRNDQIAPEMHYPAGAIVITHAALGRR
jgi:hypothetical protein